MMFYGWTNERLDFDLKLIEFITDTAEIKTRQILEAGKIIIDNSKGNTSQSVKMEHKSFVNNQIFHTLNNYT